MKRYTLILLILFGCGVNRKEVSVYTKPTVISNEDTSQDDLLEWSKKLTPSERDSFVKYFFYSDREIQDIKNSIDRK